MPLLDKAERFLAAINEADLNTAIAMLGRSVNVRTPMGTFKGEKGFRDWLLRLFRAMPDMRFEIRGLAVETDRTLAFEWRSTGTFTGPLAMPDGDIPPTGRAVDFSGADFWRVEDGLIVSYHNYFDVLEFLRQLGLAVEDQATVSADSGYHG